ncbi:MAG: MBL fold metallo-hydrolase [Thermoanaerobaculia bacterium]|nr:MBL fold metallo-hydrolase [Thermoanaerobaculia bacterium]
MTERERWIPLSMTLAGIPFRGVSIAGRETWFRVPSLDLAFDVGRSPAEIVPAQSLFLSHAHLDHAGGLAYWASQRRLLRLAPARVFADPATVPAWRQILALHAGLEGVEYHVAVEGLSPGASVDLRKDLSVSAFRADHRVPALGFVASEVRRRLVPGWQGRAEEEIRDAVARGEEVTRRCPRPIVAFTGDTGIGFFESAPREAFEAKVLLLECSFVEPEDLPRARNYGHLHLDDVAERADLFANEAIVLTHLTLRGTPDELRRTIGRRLPAALVSRTVPFLPE